MSATTVSDSPPDLLDLAILTGRLIDARNPTRDATKWIVLEIREEINRIRAGGDQG